VQLQSFFSPLGEVKVYGANTKGELAALMNDAAPGQLVVVNFGSEKYEPSWEMIGPYESLSQRYPDVLFLSVDAIKAQITDIVQVPTFKLLKDGIKLELLAGCVDPDKLESSIKKHLP